MSSSPARDTSATMIKLVNCRMPEHSISALAEENDAVRDILRQCLLRAAFINANFHVKSDRGRVRSMLKCYRGAALLLDDGRVLSTEHFRIDNPRLFYTSSPQEALESVLDNGTFDNAALLFSDAPPTVSLTAAFSWLDGNPDTAVKGVEGEVRFLEYQLNHMLSHDEGLEEQFEAFLEDPEETPDDVPIPVAPLRRIRAEERAELEAELRELRREEARQAIDLFMEQLKQQDILPIMQKAGLNGCRWYNWLLGQGHEPGINREEGRKRQQALAAYPILHCLLSKHDHPVAEAVSRGTPLAPVLAQIFGQPKQVISAINGASVSDLGIEAAPDQDRLALVMRDVSCMPPGRAPKGKEEWRAFFASVRMSEQLSRIDNREADEILAQVAGKWDRMDANKLEFAIPALRDMVNDIYQTAIAPIALHVREEAPPNRQTLAKHLFANRSLIQIADVVNKWNEKRADIKAMLQASYPVRHRSTDGLCWLPLHDHPISLGEQYSMYPLSREAELSEESSRLGHCVGTYTGRCMYGGSHIVSLRTPDGARSFATAELSHQWICENAGKKELVLDPTVGHLPPGVIQFQGTKNKNPSHDHWATLWDYMDKIVQGTIKIDKDNLDEELTWRKANRDKLRLHSYDVMNPRAVEEAWKMYREFFPKRLRRRPVKDVYPEMRPEEHPSPSLQP